MAKAVAKVEELQVPAVHSEDRLISLIERAAFGPNANMEQAERMLAMVAKERAQKSEREFNEKMARAQAKMRPVAADADNKQTRSKYATYAALDRALRPIYTEEGFAPSFNTLPDAPENHVRVVCDLTNCGHTRRYQLDMPADGKGAKGGDVMTKTHATGSAVSYGMRYLLKMMFNVAVGEADDDGNAAGDVAPRQRITEEQVKEIEALIEKAGIETQVILERFKLEALADMTPSDHKTAVSKLNATIKFRAG
jgi:hypothetical protein